MAKIATNTNFPELLQDEKLVIVDFWATWCGPCKMLAPVVKSVAEKYDGKIKVGKVNVDDEGELAAIYGVSAIPTVVRIDGGKVTKTSVGFVPQAQLEEALGLAEL
jgi:thioredoxin 1